jgi:hypothetical protein
MTQLTVKEVKEIMPDVHVRINGQVLPAWVRGRLLDYPKVYPQGIDCMGIEYSWEAITYSFNTGIPLEV